MFGNLVKHMVVKANTGVDGDRTFLIKIYRHRNCRLAGASHLAGHPVIPARDQRFTLHTGQQTGHVIIAANRDADTPGKARLMRLITQDDPGIAGFVAQRVRVGHFDQQIIRIRRRHRNHIVECLQSIREYISTAKDVFAFCRQPLQIIR